MSGNNLYTMRFIMEIIQAYGFSEIRALWVIIFALSPVNGEHVEFKGKAYLDGKILDSQINLVVYQGTRAVGYVNVNKDGSLYGQARVDSNRRHNSFYITPSNSDYFSPQKSVFLDGFIELVSFKAVNEMELKLRSIALMRRAIIVEGPSSQPMANVSVQIAVSVTNTELPKVPVWRFRTRTTTSKDGKFIVPYLPGMASAYDVKADHRAGNIVMRGSLSIKLGGSKSEIPSRFKMEVTGRLRAILQLAWDPGYSKEPFHPQEQMIGGIRFTPLPPGQHPNGFYIIPNRDETRRELLNIPPGEYRLTLIDRPALLYRVAGDSDVMTIPENDEEVVEHKLFLLPRMQLNVSGKVVDAASGSALSKAIVAVGDKAVATDNDGRFSIVGLPGGQITVNARHQDYFPASNRVMAEPDIEHILKLKPYPVLSGQVMSGITKIPSAGVSLELYQGRSRRKTVTDKEGKYGIHLGPGDYDFLVSRRPDEKTRPVVVFRGDITMREKDYSFDFPVREIGRVDVKVEPFESVVGEKNYKTTVCFLQNDIFWGAALLDENRKASAYVAEGEYDVIIAFGEKRGSMVGTGKVSSTKKQSLRLDVKQVLDLQFDGKRMVLGK
ncbi:MAG: carboxypeptidase-like regulatory domain-containing protein [Planctomycetota bacterium]|nr:carboxypeptidase-like regulatory domain-containing protein [Planctomycetota bacterium]